MNTEKAIDLLDNLIGMVDDNQENDYDSALHMAIDVLKTQADTDTVSRKAVLDAVCEELDSIDHVPQWVFDRLTKKIENLPPAQPTGTPLHDNGSDYSHGFADGYKQGLKDEESERVRCKDCLYWVAHDKRCVYLNHGFAPNMWCCHGRRADD